MRILPFALVACLVTPAFAQEAISPEAANEALAQSAEAARKNFESMTFEAFRDSLTRVPGTGSFVVNGDVTIRNEKLLREFFAQHVQTATTFAGGIDNGEAIVSNVGGIDKIWNTSQKRNLTYCVSDDFAARKPFVVADMEAAALAFEAVADLDFTHIPGEDGNCDTSNDNVVFDVRPVNAGGEFLAAAFFPDDPRRKRSVVIDPSSFNLDPNGLLTLRGILRHELGHTIGLRHEHTRPESGRCFEDTNWRVVTNYDAFSVMHYPHCNGQGDWSLRLTATDKSAVACLYGAADGFQIDAGLVDVSSCAPGAVAPAITTTNFGPFDLAQGAEKLIGSFDVLAGSVFKASMSGSGDPDLYVKFGGFVDQRVFDCRPYSSGADEVCELDVPAGASQASVMVRGYRAAEFSLEVSFSAP